MRIVNSKVPTSSSKLSSAVNTTSSHFVQPSSAPTSTEAEFDLRKIDSLKFSMQILITLFMLTLCWSGLQSKDSETQALYWGGITGIIGWWMPSPGGLKTPTSSQTK
jgi:hypothetical protein